MKTENAKVGNRTHSEKNQCKGEAGSTADNKVQALTNVNRTTSELRELSHYSEAVMIELQIQVEQSYY